MGPSHAVMFPEPHSRSPSFPPFSPLLPHIQEFPLLFPSFPISQLYSMSCSSQDVAGKNGVGVSKLSCNPQPCSLQELHIKGATRRVHPKEPECQRHSDREQPKARGVGI